MRTTRIWHEHCREDSEGRETVLRVHLEIHPGLPASRLDPAEGPSVDILDVRDEAGNPADLTDEEMDDYMYGEAMGDVLDAAKDEDEARAEDAWEAARDR